MKLFPPTPQRTVCSTSRYPAILLLYPSSLVCGCPGPTNTNKRTACRCTTVIPIPYRSFVFSHVQANMTYSQQRTSFDTSVLLPKTYTAVLSRRWLGMTRHDALCPSRLTLDSAWFVDFPEHQAKRGRPGAPVRSFNSYPSFLFSSPANISRRRLLDERERGITDCVVIPLCKSRKFVLSVHVPA